MIEVEIRHLRVLVRAIDTESKVLSIWITQIPPNLDFHVCLFDFSRQSWKIQHIGDCPEQVMASLTLVSVSSVSSQQPPACQKQQPSRHVAP